MELYKVVFTKTAYSEVDEMHAYIKQETSFERANQWFLDLEKKIQSLELFPFRCKVSNASVFFTFEVRQFLFNKRFLIFYKIVKNQVFILHIFRTEQNYSKKIKENYDT